MSKDIIDIAAERAQQQAAMQAWARDLHEVANAEQIGKWYPPAHLEGMVFIRCGSKLPDGSMPPACARMLHKHKAMGAKDAPAGMRPPVGFERDDGRGVYVWYFPEIWQNIQHIKHASQRRADPKKVFEHEVGGGAQIEIREGVMPTKRR
jgi:hypothetical protein